MSGRDDATNDDKSKKLVDIVQTMRRKKIAAHSATFDRSKFCEYLKKKNKKFAHLESSTIMKWVNISVGFVNQDMQPALNLCVEMCDEGRGGGMVWEVIERKVFLNLSCYEKIFVFRGMSGKHLYRMDLSRKIRKRGLGVKSNSRGNDDLPLGTGAGDKITRWTADECLTLINHVKSIVRPLTEFANQNDISLDILVAGSLQFEDDTTDNGLAGVFQLLFKDVPGPRSSRTPTYALREHKNILLGLLKQYGQVPSEEEEDTESDTERMVEETFPLKKKTRTGGGKKLTSTALPGKAPRNLSTRILVNNNEIEARRQQALEEQNADTVEPRMNTDSVSEEILASGHASFPSDSNILSTSPPGNSPILREPNPVQQGAAGTTIAPSRIRRRDPIDVANDELVDDENETNRALQPCTRKPRLGNIAKNPPESRLSDIDEELPVRRPIPGPTTRQRGLVDIEEEGNNAETPIRIDVDMGSASPSGGVETVPPSNETLTLMGRIFEEHEKAIEEMMRADGDKCIPSALERMDDTIDRDDIKHEVFPISIAPASIARRLGIKVVQDLQNSLDEYVCAQLGMLGSRRVFDDWGERLAFDPLAKKMYFSGKKNELENRGFVLFQNILRQENCNNRLDVDAVFAYVEENFRQFPVTRNRRIEAERNSSPNVLWVHILNESSQGYSQTAPDQCRFQTWPWKMDKGLPFDVSKKKASIEILLGLLVQKMFDSAECEDKRVRPFAFPKYGSIFLRTCQNTKAQIAHCDFPPVEPQGLLPYHEPPPLHDLFLMYSGRQPFAIRVWGNSHTTMNVDTSNKKAFKVVAQAMSSKLEIVPPYSILVGRGDVIHAGASGEELRMAFQDYKGTRKEEKEKGNDVLIQCGNYGYNTRGHMYATRGKYTFDNVFRTPPDFPTKVNDHNL